MGWDQADADEARGRGMAGLPAEEGWLLGDGGSRIAGHDESNSTPWAPPVEIAVRISAWPLPPEGWLVRLPRLISFQF